MSAIVGIPWLCEKHGVADGVPSRLWDWYVQQWYGSYLVSRRKNNKLANSANLGNIKVGHTC